MNNVFKTCTYYRWIYPKFWWRNISLFFRRFKWAYQRATRGYADCDVWDMDNWILNLFHGALNHLADNHWGYPGDDRFPEDETWTKYLREMAQLFYNADESNMAYPHPAYDKWVTYLHEHAEVNILRGENPHDKEMFLEECELSKKRQGDFEKAWKMMGEVFFNLWD